MPSAVSVWSTSADVAAIIIAVATAVVAGRQGQHSRLLFPCTILTYQQTTGGTRTSIFLGSVPFKAMTKEEHSSASRGSGSSSKLKITVKGKGHLGLHLYCLS